MQDVLNEKLTLVSINISTFSGYRRATREHIAALGGNLPASAAITEGSIKVFPCEGTKTLMTVRRGIFRTLQAKGVRALGSQNVFAVLTEDLPEIEKEIASAETAFIDEVHVLDANYDQMFESHIVANAEAEAIIRSLKVDRVAALAKCRFSSDVFKIAPFVREGQTEEEGVEGIVRGLGRQLYEEIASEMEKLLKNDTFAKNQRVGQKSLRPLKAAVQKMKKLSFLDPSVEGAITLISDIMKVLPQGGYIEGQSFVTLEKLVETAADPDALLNAASKVKNGVRACDVLFPPAPRHAEETQEASGDTEMVQAESTAGTLPLTAAVLPSATHQRPAVVLLPPLPPGNPVGRTVQPGVVQLSVPSRPAPALKPRDALKVNSLMF